MRQAGNRLRLIDYGCENGFVSKRTFPGKTPRPAHSRETLCTILARHKNRNNYNDNYEKNNFITLADNWTFDNM
jgi:hypothetical protein